MSLCLRPLRRSRSHLPRPHRLLRRSRSHLRRPHRLPLPLRLGLRSVGTGQLFIRNSEKFARKSHLRNLRRPHRLLRRQRVRKVMCVMQTGCANRLRHRLRPPERFALRDKFWRICWMVVGLVASRFALKVRLLILKRGSVPPHSRSLRSRPRRHHPRLRRSRLSALRGLCVIRKRACATLSLLSHRLRHLPRLLRSRPRRRKSALRGLCVIKKRACATLNLLSLLSRSDPRRPRRRPRRLLRLRIKRVRREKHKMAIRATARARTGLRTPVV